MCIPYEFKCDGDKHCQNGDDESECGGECNNGAVWCPNSNSCLPKWKKCNGVWDCANGEDEKVTGIQNQFPLTVSLQSSKHAYYLKLKHHSKELFLTLLNEKHFRTVPVGSAAEQTGRFVQGLTFAFHGSASVTAIMTVRIVQMKNTVLAFAKNQL